MDERSCAGELYLCQDGQVLPCQIFLYRHMSIDSLSLGGKDGIYKWNLADMIYIYINIFIGKNADDSNCSEYVSSSMDETLLELTHSTHGAIVVRNVTIGLAEGSHSACCFGCKSLEVMAVFLGKSSGNDGKLWLMMANDG